MLSKNLVVSINERRGDQRTQGSSSGDIRENNNKRPHPGSRTNSHNETTFGKQTTLTEESSSSSIGATNHSFIFSGSSSPLQQPPSSSSNAMDPASNDSRKENRRNPSSKDSSTSSSLCRDFMRNICKRGSKCRFSHTLPDSENNSLQNKRLRQHAETSSAYNKTEALNMGGCRQDQKESHTKDLITGAGPPMQLKVMFCHDHQNMNTECQRGNACRFIHCERQEEEEYRRSGYLPPHIRDQAINKGVSCDLPALFGARPICKDHLKKQCKRKSNCRFRHLTPMEYDLEITRCIQSSVARQQQQQEKEHLLDDHQDQQRNQQQQMSQVRLQQSIPCQATNSGQIPYTDNGDVQHSYISSNGDGGGYGSSTTCDQGGSWDTTQNSNGNYVDFLGPQDVAAKRSRFDHAGGSIGLQLPQNESQGMLNRGSFTPTTEEDLDMIQQENILLKQRVEELKKQVTDLSTTNDFLLDQNAQLRLSGHSIHNRTVTTPIGQQTGQSAITTVVQAQHGGPLAVVSTLPPQTEAQIVENIGGPQQGQQQALGLPQSGQLNQPPSSLQQNPSVTISSITLAVQPPAMSVACQPAMAATSMSIAPGQPTVQLVPTSITLPGPTIQQSSPLTTSMSIAGAIQQQIPSSISMAGPLQQTLPTSMRIAGPLVNHQGQHQNPGPQNSVNGRPQQIQQAASLPTTMGMTATIQQTNRLQTSMNITGPSLSHSGQHQGGNQQNAVTRSSQQMVGLSVQPLSNTAQCVSSMAMPLNSHPVQTNVGNAIQAMQGPPPQQQTQQPPPGMGPPQVPQSSMAQPPLPPPQHVAPPGMQRTLQQQPPPVSVAVAGATSDTVTVRETRLITYPISSIQAQSI